MTAAKGISSEILRDNENDQANKIHDWAIFMDPDQGQERHQLSDTITRLPMESTASIHLNFLNLRNYNMSNSPFY